MAYTETTERRITFLSLLSSATQYVNVGVDVDPYVEAGTWLERMTTEGFFERVGQADTPKEQLARPATSSEPSPARSSSTSSDDELYRLKKGWEESADPCPLCVEEGRDGTIRYNGNESGPEAECSLRARKKFGSKWREAGECEWKDFGDRYK